MAEARWLKAALNEMGPVPELPPEYRPVRPPLLISTGKALLYLALAACLFAIIAGRLVPALAIALVTVLAVAIALFLYFFLEIRLRTPAVVRVLERVYFEGPRTARQVLESVRPQLPSMTLVPRSDLLLDTMSHLEEWAGEHGRASQVSRVALWRSPDPPEPRQVGHLVRSTASPLPSLGRRRKPSAGSPGARSTARRSSQGRTGSPAPSSAPGKDECRTRWPHSGESRIR